MLFTFPTEYSFSLDSFVCLKKIIDNIGGTKYILASRKTLCHNTKFTYNAVYGYAFKDGISALLHKSLVSESFRKHENEIKLEYV